MKLRNMLLGVVALIMLVGSVVPAQAQYHRRYHRRHYRHHRPYRHR